MTPTIGVWREPAGERRVALVPEDARRLVAAGLPVLVTEGAGAAARIDDDAYVAAGATVAAADEVLDRADVLLSVGRGPGDRLRTGQVLIGLLAPLVDPGYAATLAQRGVTALSLDGIPRTVARAQAMDVLTSQASVAGYKAVLVAAGAYERFFPLLSTAAGTVRPAQVLVLGAGVAGLQAIGTARRLGAVVRAFDVRPAGRADAASVGAAVLKLAAAQDAAGEGGYAREQTEEQQEALRAELAAHVAAADVVITTAQVPGRRPPLLVSDAAVKAMRPGSVVVDLAASDLGGNVDGSAPDRTVVTDNGVTVIGAPHLAASMPAAASTAFSRNVTALLTYLIHDGAVALDPADEIVAGILVTSAGAVVHPATARLLEGAAP